MVQCGENQVDWSTVSTSIPSGLAENEIHIWRVDVRSSFPGLEVPHQLLSPAECERAQKFVQFRDRARFIIAHGALRCILSRYDPVGPECHEFEIGQWGKPYLRSSSHSTTSFNLSHSGDMAVVAIASGCEVGIDIEQIRYVAEEASIVERVMSEPDRVLYQAASAPARRALFFQLWTGHEAQLKATGQGIGEGLPSIPGSRGQISSWTIEPPAAGYAASVAAIGFIDRVRYFDFAWNGNLTV